LEKRGQIYLRNKKRMEKRGQIYLRNKKRIFKVSLIFVLLFCRPALPSTYYSKPCDVFYFFHKAGGPCQLPSLKGFSY
ncbi:hypothetical protein PU99_23345, partial [Pseudomonas putida]